MKTLKILEVMWFTIATIAVAAGIFKLITEPVAQSTGFFIIAVLAFAFGFARRNERIKIIKREEVADVADL